MKELTADPAPVTADSAEPLLEKATPSAGRLRRGLPVLGRLSAAASLAAVLSYLVWSILPQGLDVRTDVVGYPIHQNFDVFQYFRMYYVVAILFPLTTLVTYVLLRRLRRGPVHHKWLRPRLPSLPAAVSAEVPVEGRAVFGRMLFVGAVVGLELAFILHLSRRFWVAVVGCAVGYMAFLSVLSALQRVPLPARTTNGRRAAANAMAAPLTVLLLYGVSAATQVTVVTDGRIRHHPWMPLWLAVAATLVLLGVIGRAIARSTSAIALHRVERSAVFLVAGSVAVFLVTARLPDPVFGMDFYHDGENLAAAHLVGGGAFPWRDVLFIHGLIEDVFRSLTGMRVFGNDVWGAQAGMFVFLGPLNWVGLYLLNVYLFGRNWLFLVLTTSLLLQNWLTPYNTRFILVPFLLLLLAALLRTPTRTRAAAVVALGVVNIVLSPESAFAVLTAGATVVAYEVWNRQPGAPVVQRFQRTLWCMAAAVVVSAALFAYLALNHALGSFFFYFQTFIPDHALTGGIPVAGRGFDFWFAIVAPVAVAVLMLWRFGSRLVSGHAVAVSEWVMASLSVFILLYFRKFLSRADGHAFQVLAVSLPLLYYALHQLVDVAETAVSRRRLGFEFGRRTTRHPITFVLVALVIVATPGPALGNAVRRVPHSWDVASPAESPELGYTTGTALKPGLLHDLDVALDSVLEPDDALFDMSNSPALFHYLLRRQPATRYYHVSMAIRQRTQRDLINQLRRTRPRLVVFDAEFHASGWDGISNAVRHYDVSQYILRRYRPLVKVHDFLFLIRSDIQPPPLDPLTPKLTQPFSTEAMLGLSRPCDWGSAPAFLTDQPSSRPRSAGVPMAFTVAQTPAGQDVTLTVPPGVRLRQFSRLEIETRGPLRQNTFRVSQLPPGRQHAISFKTLDRGTHRYWVHVGSCAQWYTLDDTKLLLRSSLPQDIVAVRLYR